jgi:hypothetical protein
MKKATATSQGSSRLVASAGAGGGAVVVMRVDGIIVASRRRAGKSPSTLAGALVVGLDCSHLRL